MKNDHASFELEACAGANMEKAFFPFKREKTTLHGKIMLLEGGSDTVVENISGPLDCAKADPTTATNS